MRANAEGKFRIVIGLLLGLSILAAAMQTFSQDKVEYRFTGSTMEGCSCSVTCSCPWMGLRKGCQAVNVIAMTGGTYKGVNLAGAKIAHGGLAGNRIYLYIDASDAQREAATAFAKAYWASEGKVEGVRNVKIDISGDAGRYTVRIDGGKIAQLTTEPILGGDKKNPVMHTNTSDPYPMKQARTVKGTFHDGDISFTLENTNSYFNEHIERSGKM
jgi:hypothetical protein